MSEKQAWGLGLVTQSNNTTLDTWFPQPLLGSINDDALSLQREQLANCTGYDELRKVTFSVELILTDLHKPPSSTEDAYLRLHVLSHRLMPPNSINLDGIFGFLPNIVWTNYGPCSVDDINRLRAAVRAAGKMPVTVKSVDKFPAMLDYVVPQGVRIGDGARVRLGAYLAEGTTVMHEGFVNFNAGTLGTSMVEGRISQGVIVGNGSDIGGGASTMGTLSGGGSQRVALGERCLLGANSGLGIPLGDDCVVEAGLYLTAGTKVTFRSARSSNDPDNERIVSARELAGISHALFRRNSLNGRVEVLAHHGDGIQLNEALHKN
ncbi:MAG: 2,3,4,5-tetrahydropyridine-2,6-dicarboxylate N-succinyltransferase [Actinomycetaceae bacterium]|nr:2,3,4,5-tetrahydropyridine-2,6-dicarboxylate N-succinyltransferase [Actinomycetaceae bacterium]